jgi:hypothetical protein
MIYAKVEINYWQLMSSMEKIAARHFLSLMMRLDLDTRDVPV